MTALKQYQKLESPGLWRDTPDAQMRDVVVGFGHATLVFTDPRNETALSHWSLAAVRRTNPGMMPALYAPGDDSAETLELDDLDMIAALAEVQAAVQQQRPRPGRLRGTIVAVGTLLVIGLGAMFVPDALYSHTTRVVPAAKRAEIGQAALDDLIRLTGAPCANPAGRRALAAMAEGLFGPSDTPILLVLPEALSGASHLPGGVVLLGRALLTGADGPEVAAGAALVETARARAVDPLLAVLHHAGLAATFRLLTSGTLPTASVEGYGEVLLRSAPAPLDDQSVLEAFRASGVPSTPYARSVDPTGETVLGLIEADPFAGAAPQPLMADGDWLSLQDICES